LAASKEINDCIDFVSFFPFFFPWFYFLIFISVKNFSPYVHFLKFILLSKLFSDAASLLFSLFSSVKEIEAFFVQATRSNQK